MRKVGRIVLLPLVLAAIAFGSYWMPRSNTLEDLIAKRRALVPDPDAVERIDAR